MRTEGHDERCRKEQDGVPELQDEDGVGDEDTACLVCVGTEGEVSDEAFALLVLPFALAPPRTCPPSARRFIASASLSPQGPSLGASRQALHNGVGRTRKHAVQSTKGPDAQKGGPRRPGLSVAASLLTSEPSDSR